MMMFFHVEHDSARERRSGRSRVSTRWSRTSKGRRRSRAHMVVDCVRTLGARECQCAELGASSASALGLSKPGRVCHWTQRRVHSPYSHNGHSIFSPGNINNAIGVLVTSSINKDWMDGCPRAVRLCVRETHNDKQSRKRRRVTCTS